MSSNNIAKLPPITRDTKILCFDAESNGLHGEAFAIGAVVVDSTGEILDEFTARCEIEGNTDIWVEENVLPVIVDMHITHSSYKHMRDNFWAWFMKAMEKSDYVLVANGYPVEYRLLTKSQEDDLDVRYWQHPFPILDLTSLMLGAGVDSSTKNKMTQEIIEKNQLSRHHPVHDSIVSAALAYKALLD